MKKALLISLDFKGDLVTRGHEFVEMEMELTFSDEED